MQLKMFCLCDNELLKDVENLNYLPVGLGKNNFQKNGGEMIPERIFL